MNRERFTLFVAGRTPPSTSARAAARQFLDEYLPDRYELQIVDVLEDPEAAEQARVMATPTLWRQPAHRVVGDLHDHDLLAHALGLPVPPRATDPTESTT